MHFFAIILISVSSIFANTCEDIKIIQKYREELEALSKDKPISWSLTDLQIIGISSVASSAVIADHFVSMVTKKRFALEIRSASISNAISYYEGYISQKNTGNSAIAKAIREKLKKKYLYHMKKAIEYNQLIPESKKHLGNYGYYFKKGWKEKGIHNIFEKHSKAIKGPKKFSGKILKRLKSNKGKLIVAGSILGTSLYKLNTLNDNLLREIEDNPYRLMALRSEEIKIICKEAQNNEDIKETIRELRQNLGVLLAVGHSGKMDFAISYSRNKNINDSSRGLVKDLSPYQKLQNQFLKKSSKK